jgi:hypothetical protein
MNNPVYYNAALAGFLQGSLKSQGGQSSASPTLITAAQAYASSVDASIATAQGAGFDPKVSSASGVTVVPTTAAEANGLATRPLAVQALCAAQINAFTTDPTEADYAPLASNIAASFLLYTGGSSLT